MRPVEEICPVSIQGLSKKTLTELRREAKRLGLVQVGTKKALIERIGEVCQYHQRVDPYCLGRSPFPMLFVPVTIWGLPIEALLDTAADTSLISYQWLQRAMALRQSARDMRYSDSCPATARGVGGKGAFKGQLAPVEMVLGGESSSKNKHGQTIEINYPLMVMDNPIEQLILGVDFLLLTQAKLDLGPKHQLELDGVKIPLKLRKLRA